jgi:hypothetical protein
MDFDDEEDENARPSRKNPILALVFLPLFWWLMYGMATGDEPRLRGSRAALKAVANFFAQILGPTGCIIVGLLTMAGAAYWLLRTMRLQSEWDEQQRRELIRERQRMAQARNQAQSGQAG